MKPFKDLLSEGMAEERAFAKGAEAKKAGKPRKSPYDLPGQGKLKTAWLKGYDDAS